jgi:hypothetical protein
VVQPRERLVQLSAQCGCDLVHQLLVRDRLITLIYSQHGVAPSATRFVPDSLVFEEDDAAYGVQGGALDYELAGSGSAAQSVAGAAAVPAGRASGGEEPGFLQGAQERGRYSDYRIRRVRSTRCRHRGLARSVTIAPTAGLNLLRWGQLQLWFP